jgi:hypothetical protein
MPLLGADGRPRALERGALFAFRLALDGAVRVVLPDDPALRWLGATLVREAGLEARDAYAAPLP